MEGTAGTINIFPSSQWLLSRKEGLLFTFLLFVSAQLQLYKLESICQVQGSHGYGFTCHTAKKVKNSYEQMQSRLYTPL